MSEQKETAVKLVPGSIHQRMEARFIKPTIIANVLESLTEKLCDLLDSAMRYEILLSLKDAGITELVYNQDYMFFGVHCYGATNILEGKIGEDEAEFIGYIIDEFSEDHDLDRESLSLDELLEFAKKIYDSDLGKVQDIIEALEVDSADPQFAWLFDLLTQIKVVPVE